MRRLKIILEKIEVNLQVLSQQAVEEPLSFFDLHYQNVLMCLREMILASDLNDDIKPLAAAIIYLQTLEIGDMPAQAKAEKSRIASLKNQINDLCLSLNDASSFFKRKVSNPRSLWNALVTSTEQKPEIEFSSVDASISQSTVIEGFEFTELGESKQKKTMLNRLQKNKIETFDEVTINAFALEVETVLQPLAHYRTQFNSPFENYFSETQLNFLETLYKDMMYFYPKWTYEFQPDESGFIAADRVKKWFDLSQKTALDDMKRDCRVLNESGGSEEECISRLERMVSQSSYSEEDKKIVFNWLKLLGGQDCDFETSYLADFLPTNGKADGIYFNWDLKADPTNPDLKFIYLTNSLHITMALEQYAGKQVCYIGRANGNVVALDQHSAAEEMTASQKDESSKPIMNFVYELRLDVVDKQGVPRLIKAKLRSYTNAIQAVTPTTEEDYDFMVTGAKILNGETSTSPDIDVLAVTAEADEFEEYNSRRYVL